MTTKEIQRVEEISDLELLSLGDCLQINGFGKVAYLGNINNRINFAKRENNHSILIIAAEKERIIPKGEELLVRGPYICNINSNMNPKMYEDKDKLLRGYGM